jgi:hypothetical protein
MTTIDPNGNYQIENLEPGEFTVCVGTDPEEVPKMMQHQLQPPNMDLSKDLPKEAQPPLPKDLPNMPKMAMPEIRIDVPKELLESYKALHTRYGNPTISKLKLSLQEGKNTHDIDLK